MWSQWAKTHQTTSTVFKALRLSRPSVGVSSSVFFVLLLGYEFVRMLEEFKWVGPKSPHLHNLFMLKQNVFALIIDHISKDFLFFIPPWSEGSQSVTVFLYTVINGFLQLNKYVCNGYLPVHVCIFWSVFFVCVFVCTYFCTMWIFSIYSKYFWCI